MVKANDYINLGLQMKTFYLHNEDYPRPVKVPIWLQYSTWIILALLAALCIYIFYGCSTTEYKPLRHSATDGP